ncbi:MAG: glycosyltransferase family 2 protein [Bacteroidales bacterium]|nr:glycosyltransferase family 2 protein [Bacteroidales bacterium]
MDVSIIIVNYNTCALIRNCLKSVFEQTKDIDFEVIVSDNGSKDGSVEMIKQEFPQVILIENNANLGFGAANNRGVKIAKGKYILYLNSDTILLNNAVKLFFDYWENSPEKDRIGALGGNLLNEKGGIALSHIKFSRPLNEIFWFIMTILSAYVKYILKLFHINYRRTIMDNIGTYTIGEVECVSGADLFLKNNDLAFFDERFFLYFEETNLEWFMKKKGLLRLIIDGPKIVHLYGKSGEKKWDARLDDFITFGAIQQDLSRIKFIKYNISSFYAWILKVLLAFFWLLPSFYKKTKQYRKEIWKI